jgi:hypothetical protein
MRMQDKKLIISLFFTVLVLSATVTPSIAFIYPDGSQDDYFENYGPRIDQILIKKYAGSQAEIDALKAGEIDFTDIFRPLPEQIEDMSNDPNIAIVGYGGEATYYTLNFNNNPNEYLGNPPNPLYPNPVYETNPCVVTEFRQACSHLINRSAICTGPGQDLYEPIFTPLPAYMTTWIHPDISYTGSLSVLAYPPSIADAAARLDAGRFILTGSPDGYRYWDKDHDLTYGGVGEDLNVIFYTRKDALRKGAADMLCAGFDNPAIRVHYTRIPCNLGEIYWQKCMVEKDYHMYTVGWTYIGPDPDILYDLYHWDNYYHPEDPPNFGAISQYDLTMQEQLRTIKHAADEASALAACLSFQERFAQVAAECPLASFSAPKAYNKWYTGGNDGVAKGDAEDKYRGLPWNQVVNQNDQGTNNYHTFLNSYPGAYQYGDGNMIARYGWEDNTMPQILNPLYSTWPREYDILSLIYGNARNTGWLYSAFSPSIRSDPYSPSLLYENWTTSAWIDPSDGSTKAKIKVIIRPDIVWSDGEAFTTDDVFYTFSELPKELHAKGCSDVWWQPLNNIKFIERLDKNTLQIFMEDSDCWWTNSFLDTIVIPKHIWQPFIATHDAAEISGDMSTHPEMLIGAGPFIYVSNTVETLLLRRNPNYCATMDKSVSRFEPLQNSSRFGVLVQALPPSSQLSPFRIRSDSSGEGHVQITVPITNLDVDDAGYTYKKIELVCSNGTVLTLAEIIQNLNPLEKQYEQFSLYNLAAGSYVVRVTVETIGGSTYDWVRSNLSSDRWQMFLGPRTVEKEFEIVGTSQQPDHDVAVSAIRLSKSTAIPGDLVGVMVDVENKGNFPETFGVTVYADIDTTAIGDEVLVGTQTAYLTEFGFSTLILSWDTTSVPVGDLWISAEAQVVAGENNMDDNLLREAATIHVLPNIHDVAVTSILPSENAVYVGEPLSIDVQMQNQGNLAEDVVVCAYADLNVTLIGDEVAIGTKNVVLQRYAKSTVTFDWETLGSVGDNYTLSAVASPVAEELDLDDNNMTDGVVRLFESVPCPDVNVTCPAAITVNPSIFTYDGGYQARLINIGNAIITSTGFEGGLRIVGSRNETIRLCVDHPDCDSYTFYLPENGEVEVPLWLMFQPETHWETYNGNFTLRLTVCGTHRRELTITGISIIVCQNGAYIVNDGTVTFTWNLTGGSLVYLEAETELPPGWTYNVSPSIGTLFETPQIVTVNITAPLDAEEGEMGRVTLRAYKNATGTMIWQFIYFASTDNKPPKITTPGDPMLTPDGYVTFHVNASDPSGISQVSLQYSVDSGPWQNKTMEWEAGDTFNSTTYMVRDLFGTDSKTVEYFFSASDWLGNQSQSLKQIIFITSDIAVTEVIVTGVNVQGQVRLELDVTVANLGTLPLSFANIGVYANSTLVATQPVLNLQDGFSACLQFAFNLTKANYVITACAFAIPNETNTENNAMHMANVLHLQIQGDINFDGTVDIFDIAMVALQFGRPPPPITDSRADINHDGLIDIFDIVVVALHFGETV